MEVLSGLKGLLQNIIRPNGLTAKVNAELRRIWEESTGHDPQAMKKLAEIERRIENLMAALEEGLMATDLANTRLRCLLEEKARLTSSQPTHSSPPQIDTATVSPYLSRIERVLAKGQVLEVKKLLKTCVEEIVLEPEECQVTINYTTPKMSSPELSLSMVAGARYTAIHEKLSNWSVEYWPLPTKGRRTDLHRAATL